jgi:phosphoribosylformylglycinamidine synthase
MGSTVVQLYRAIDETRAYCFNVESKAPLSDQEMDCLRLILAEGFLKETVSTRPLLQGDRVIEVGPRLNFATAWSSNMVSICQSIGLQNITRVERSRRYVVPQESSVAEFIKNNHDRMTECHYPEPLQSFATGVVPEPVYEVDMLSKGPAALQEIPGISMDEWDRNFYYDYFVKKHGRNPTIVEIMDLNNANSEHSRHGFFKGKQIIDGKSYDVTLFDMVTETLRVNPKGSVVAFKDNSSVVAGFEISTLLPHSPGEPSAFSEKQVCYDILLTAETHNFPTGVAPFPGAETGTGGRIRDVQGTGRGGFVIAGTAGYCVGDLNIPGYPLSWENNHNRPENLASPLEIEIEASNGASDYGNKFGEPLIQGFTRSFDVLLDNGERWAYLKPIMFTGGIGQIDHRHIEKGSQEKGLLIVQVGGPAYRVGFGGGAASSMLQGENVSDLDFDAVQRGDAEMEQKMNRVIRACNEMGDHTLIDVIHDQGAGGPANVLKELVEDSGGWVDIRKIRVGDPTMSVLEIYVAEYQERTGFLIRPENIKKFEQICSREKVACEVLGEVTGNLRFVLHDSHDNTTPVDIDLNELLGNIPQKVFEDRRVDSELIPLIFDPKLPIREALDNVLRLVSVGSKRFLTSKVDRAVTGLVAQQQCCGPLQLPLSNVAVVAQSHFGKTGAATAIGEQPIKMLVDPAAGARMAVGEALTNLMWARVADLDQVKCSANWMWAPKLEGEGAAIYDAVKATRDVMISLGIAIDGGKDSLSMATMVDGKVVKSPRELVISLYAAVPDITKVVTPDLKEPGSVLLFINLSKDYNRLGGSAFAQTQGQIGYVVPDMRDPRLIRKCFNTVQGLIDKDLILAGHDRSDGGLIVTLLEMAFAGNCGFEVSVKGWESAIASLFSEELGIVLELREDTLEEVKYAFDVAGIIYEEIGRSVVEPQITVYYNNEVVLSENMYILRQIWEETSYQLECLQMNPDCADEEKKNIFQRLGPTYHLSFTPVATPAKVLQQKDKPKVAILRDEGSNSDREMTSAFFSAGFEPWDVCMTDLLESRISLESFRGVAAVGGFSYADVPESAKGWAATILFNERLKAMFDEFYSRQDTFSLGVCNGCQLFSLLGWVPWRGLAAEEQPRFVRNRSGRFESRWSTVRINASKAMMFSGMEDLVFGIHVDHGEGRLIFPDKGVLEKVESRGMAPIVYVDDHQTVTEAYPFNPNGSTRGLAGLCSEDGRHLALMPHPERVFLPWQAHYLPMEMRHLEVSPWLRMFQNAYHWCVANTL